MQIFFFIALVIVVLLFGLSSMSQSYAAAQQAQAVIETAHAAQIASAGNVVVIVTLAVLLLVAAGVIAYLLTRTRPQPKSGQWVSGPNARWGRIQQPDANAMFPALLTMMLYQMVQNQQHEAEQLWQMSQPDQDVPVLPDNTWDM